MSRYIVRRVIGAIPVLFLISFIIYGILLIAPGGPEARFAQNPKITAAQVDAFRRMRKFEARAVAPPRFGFFD